MALNDLNLVYITPLKFNIAPENRPFQKEMSSSNHPSNNLVASRKKNWQLESDDFQSRMHLLFQVGPHFQLRPVYKSEAN